MTKDIVNMENIKKTYDGKRFVLDDLCFSTKKGEFVLIRGLSGSGKSTLLNILGLLDTFDSGSYKLNNFNINKKSYNNYANFRSQSIGFVFQSYHLIESISISDNILLPYLYSKEKITTDVLSRMHSILDNFNLNGMHDKKVSLLSGGEKQRVAIARAIIKNPSLIIADEPTGNLDGFNSTIVMDYLKKSAKNNSTIVLVTHNDSLINYCDTSYLLQEGKLIK